MNGKDLFISLSYVDSRFVEEAETGSLREQQPRRSLMRPLLIAALTALLLMLVGCGVAYAQGWFTNYFAQNSEEPLSQGQVEYIAQNEQVIGESQVQNQWTVELRSAINDGATGYIILGIIAPEGVSLEETVENDVYPDSFVPGNGSMRSSITGAPDILRTSQGVVWDSWESSWEEDGDNLPNTKNYVIQIHPNLERSSVDPFGADAEYYIHIENILREYDDDTYRQQLLNGKYAGQDAIMFSDEETLRLRRSEVLAEGVWDFTVHFAESSRGMELLTEPVTTLAYVFRQNSENIFDIKCTQESITLTSFVLRPLGATIFYECDGGVNLAASEKSHIYAIMKDGSQTELKASGNGGNSYTSLEAATPIVLEEVDHILMADGTVIPMPE